MKKLVLSVMVIMALTTTSSAQIFGSGYSLSSQSLYSLPTVPVIPSMPSVYSVPSVTGDILGSMNVSTTTVGGYYRDNGTYVTSHVRTMPDNTNWNNYSTIGNTNPITGTVGSRARDYSIETYNYGVGQTIYTGPRGGQYYYNSNGNKTYVPKQSLW